MAKEAIGPRAHAVWRDAPCPTSTAAPRFGPDRSHENGNTPGGKAVDGVGSAFPTSAAVEEPVDHPRVAAKRAPVVATVLRLGAEDQGTQDRHRQADEQSVHPAAGRVNAALTKKGPFVDKYIPTRWRRRGRKRNPRHRVVVDLLAPLHGIPECRLTFAVYHGRKVIRFHIEQDVGHKARRVSHTRTFHGHIRRNGKT